MKQVQMKQVLLVDDDPDYSYLIRKALHDCYPGFHLETVSSGRQLVDWLASNKRPALIFLDINMPVQNGFDVLRQLKGTDLYKSIPVVMLSVSERRQDIQQSYSIGANGYLIKPMDFSELTRRLNLFSHYWFAIAQTLDSSWGIPDSRSRFS